MCIHLQAIRVYGSSFMDTVEEIVLETALTLSRACAQNIINHCIAQGCVTSYVSSSEGADGTLLRRLELERIAFLSKGGVGDSQFLDWVKGIVYEEHRGQNPS